MSEEQEMCLGDFDTEGADCSPGHVGGGNNSNYTKVLFVPSSGKPPIIGKILPDLKTKRGYFPIEYHEFSIGPNPMDVRTFYSPKCFNQKDALTDLFWKAIKERKTYSENKESAEYRRWDAVVKATRPKKGGLVYWIGRGESKIQLLFLKEAAVDIIFGSPAKKTATGADQPAIPGLVKEMREMGLSPFNLKVPDGWIKLYKTGTGVNTIVHAEIDQVKKELTENGRRKYITEPAEAAVDPAILNIKSKDIPVFETVCQEKSWTDQEIEEYITSSFTKIPNRFKKNAVPVLRNSNSGGEEVAYAVDAAYNQDVEQVDEDDIPF